LELCSTVSADTAVQILRGRGRQRTTYSPAEKLKQTCTIEITKLFLKRDAAELLIGLRAFFSQIIAKLSA
jgi:hypothetical protein